MAIEENKALVRRLVEEVWNRENLAAADELLAPTFIDHNPLPGSVSDRNGDKQAFAAARSAVHETFPDLRFTIEDLIAEDDKVVARWRMHGTHQGEYLGHPATGKQFTITGISIYRIADGQIVEAWIEPNTLGLLQQLGQIPPPGEADRDKYYVWRSLR